MCMGSSVHDACVVSCDTGHVMEQGTRRRLCLQDGTSPLSLLSHCLCVSLCLSLYLSVSLVFVMRIEQFRVHAMNILTADIKIGIHQHLVRRDPGPTDCDKHRLCSSDSVRSWQPDFNSLILAKELPFPQTCAKVSELPSIRFPPEATGVISLFLMFFSLPHSMSMEHVPVGGAHVHPVPHACAHGRRGWDARGGHL